MSLFDRLDRVARVAFEAVYAETVEVIPIAAGELSRGVATGHSYYARAIVRLEDEIVQPSGREDANRSAVIQTQPQADFALDQFHGSRPRVAAGFEIALVDRPDAPRWRVRGDPRAAASHLIAYLERLP